MERYVDPAVLAAGFTPALILAGLGALFTDRSGVFNFGVEGLMLIAAFFTAVVSYQTGHAWLGVGAGVLAAMGLSVLFWAFAMLLRADIIMIGLAVNLFATGLTSYLSLHMYGDQGACCNVDQSHTLPHWTVPVLSRLPLIGPSLTDQSVLVYLAWLAVPTAAVLLYRTRLGMHMRAVGENDEAAATVGINVARARLSALLLCGAFCGLAGAYFAEGQAGFTQHMTAGNGFIALAAETFGRATPLGTFFACVFFGLTQSLADHLNSLAGEFSELVTAIPYVATLVALIVAGVRIRRRRHAATATAPRHPS